VLGTFIEVMLKVFGYIGWFGHVISYMVAYGSVVVEGLNVYMSGVFSDIFPCLEELAPRYILPIGDDVKVGVPSKAGMCNFNYIES